MSPAMSSRRRVLAALRRQPVDYVPCCPFFNPLTPTQRRGHRWQFPWPPEAPLRQRLTYQVEQLGVDPVVPMGVDLCNPEPGVEPTAWVEADLLHKTWATPSGQLHAAVRYNDLWPHGQDIPFFSDFNVGHFVEPWLKTEADLACLKHILRTPETTEALEQVRSASAEPKALAHRLDLPTYASGGMGLTGAQHLFGVAELCIMTIEQPELVDAYLEFEHRLNIRRIEILADLGVDIVNRNGFYETADFYGPDTLEQFLGRRLRREAQVAHEAGIVMDYTVHTGVMPILDHLAGLTVESLFGIDIAFKGMDLPKLRDRLAPTKSFWIGPSSTFHIWKGPDATRQGVRQVFDVFGKTGLILAPCVSSHSIMPWQNTLAMIDEWRNLR